MAFGEGNISDQCREKAGKIRILALDVDGVMTDGKIVYDDDRRQLKFFDVKDGHGIKLLMRGGVDVAIITSRESRVVLHRARDLGIELVYQKALKKVDAFEELMRVKGVAAEEVAYVGDDLIDLPVFRRAGLSVAVADAVREVREQADYVTERRGGNGAVREICELILRLQGRWEEVTARYFA
ncbi:MAG: KdsC family phosphatase [Thermodesulfobacteriota bacterium]